MRFGPLLDRVRTFPAREATTVGADDLSIEAFQNTTCVFRDRLELLKRAAAIAPRDGAMLEFGVFQGVSINALAVQFPHREICGFDSFEGLPEPWRRSETSTYDTGHFAVESLPHVPSNVTLVKGFFDASLPAWMAERSEIKIALIHIDVDLYSSTKFVLNSLDHLIETGCVIVFDELSDWNDSGIYPEWRDGEWRALNEWLSETGRRIQVLGRGPRFEAAILVTA